MGVRKINYNSRSITSRIKGEPDGGIEVRSDTGVDKNGVKSAKRLRVRREGRTSPRERASSREATLG